MKLPQSAFAQLARPAAITLALCAGAVFLAGYAWQQLSHARQELQSAKGSHRQHAQQLQQLQTQAPAIQAQAQLLQGLQQRGIAGDEKRLDWIELLADLQRELRLPEMKYEFGAQMPLDSEHKTLWRSSTQHLELHLLHEADLLTFLARLAAQAPALIIVRSCQLAPKPADVGSSVAVAQLIAQCELQWLSLQLAS